MLKRDQWLVQPQFPQQPSNDFKWDVLINQAVPNLNAATGRLVTPRGTATTGRAGRYQNWHGVNALEQINAPLPTTSTGYTMLWVGPIQVANTGTVVNIIRTTGGGFRFEPYTTPGGVYMTATHTGVVVLNAPGPWSYAHDSRPWVVIISYDGTTASFEVKTPDGEFGSATTAAGMSEGTGTIDLSTTSGVFGAYLVGYARRPMPASMRRRLLQNPWSVLARNNNKLYFAQTDSATPAAGSGSLTFTPSGVGASNRAASGSSSATFSVSGVGASNSAASGSSSVNFTATGTGSFSAGSEASGASSLTFTASGVATATHEASGSSTLSFSAFATSPVTTEAVGSSSLTFEAQGYSPETERTRPLEGGHSTKGKKKRFILPDNTEILATTQEVYEILDQWVKPKKKKKQVVKLLDKIELKEETREEKKVERVVIKPIAIWEPDKEKYEEAVKVLKRRRQLTEILLLAA